MFGVITNLLFYIGVVVSDLNMMNFKIASDRAVIPPLEWYMQTGEEPETEDVTEEPVAG